MDIKKTLNNYGQDTKRKIISEIDKKNVIDTGNLRKSIDYKIVANGDGFNVNFSMLDYGKYVDEGTRYIKPRNFFNEVIQDSEDEFIDDLEDALAKMIEDSILKSVKK